jgi:DNA-directed RNA polymerase subunit N (RpoN/RPB10)
MSYQNNLPSVIHAACVGAVSASRLAEVQSEFEINSHCFFCGATICHHNPNFDRNLLAQYETADIVPLSGEQRNPFRRISNQEDELGW